VAAQHLSRARAQACERWAIWQFASQGRIPGIATLVNLDVACTPEAFAALCGAPAR